MSASRTIRAFVLLLSPIVFLGSWILTISLLWHYDASKMDVFGDGSELILLLLIWGIAILDSIAAAVAFALSLRELDTAWRSIRRMWTIGVIALAAGARVLLVGVAALSAPIKEYGHPSFYYMPAAGSRSLFPRRAVSTASASLMPTESWA